MTLAEQLIDQLLEKETPKEPYERALVRMQSLMDRYGDLDKVAAATMRRLHSIKNQSKLAGLYMATRDMGMTKVAKAAKLKFKDMTGKTPKEVYGPMAK